MGPDELREKLTYLAEQRVQAERVLEALRAASTERLANLELEADALLGHYADMTRESLEAYAPEDKHAAYQALRLMIVVYPADGVFAVEPELCNSELVST